MLNVLSAPVLYALELTPDCNNRCPACFNFFDRARSPLSVEEWQTVMDLIASHAHRLKLTGGEPTLYPDFPALVQVIARCGIEFTVFTNGRWQDPHCLLDCLVAAPYFTGLLVSLHGARAESHQAFTHTPGSFEETTANIGRAVERGVRVTLSTVLTTANLNELADMVALSQKLGARRVVFNRLLGAQASHLTLSDSQLIAATQTIERLRAAGLPVKHGTGIPQCLTPSSSNGCLAGVAYVAIDPWGNVRPCTHSRSMCGNLLRQPLDEIWHSTEMERFRSAIPPACHTCAAFAQCHGGCRAMAMESESQADPCMRSPLETMPTLPPLELPAGACPLARYRLRQESFGYVLMRGNTIIPVRREATDLLQCLDGQHSLEFIQQSFGEAGLALVGKLYQKGLVEL
jgi:radical SAM protein with 4Fe4S-binding SPASM domain